MELAADGSYVTCVLCPCTDIAILCHSVTGEMVHLSEDHPWAIGQSGDGIAYVEPVRCRANQGDKPSVWVSDLFDANVYTNPGGELYIGIETEVPDSDEKVTLFEPFGPFQTGSSPRKVSWTSPPFDAPLSFDVDLLSCHWNAMRVCWSLKDLGSVPRLAALGSHLPASSWVAQECRLLT